MKVKIKLTILGHFPHSFNINKVKNWQSELFEITEVDRHNIVGDSDGPNWEFLDPNVENQLPVRGNADVLIAFTNVPIQNNYFARRFSDNRVCVSYNSMTEILSYNDIPLENLLLRVLYSVSFVFRRYGNRMPLMTEPTNFSHDETRGCIFDMDGIKTDIIYSTYKPQLCSSCIHALTNNPIANNRIANNLIDKVQLELKKIDKGLYYQIADWIKKNPIWAITISSLTAIMLGTIGSIVASFIYEKIK
jgi:hypothetical protein